MDNVLASSAVNRGFEPRSGQTKDYTIGICCVSTKLAAIRSKSKDWLLPYNHDHDGSGSPTAIQIKTITKIPFSSTQGDHTLYVNHKYTYQYKENNSRVSECLLINYFP
jgi:hypothetical protein